ncbi:F0F1 ATP synthase subunit gamma [uncultured Roseovarius sp.]|uniref:F0F1 ATP synthase subunit gamma n=1 Tax=Roseovarius sp. TaxID=1486281 RepID=UPI0025EEC153|nr:FoF1 ATP synthase subunit gamma [uncultured Roseovarius sp.]
MTERLADISARIDGIRQLGAVVNAMKGIAGARAQQARAQAFAVDSYAATIAAAMSRVLAREKTPPGTAAKSGDDRPGLLVFCAEHGFAGAFSERVLDSIGARDDPAYLFLIGNRGLSIATARGLKPHWTAPLPSHTPRIPRLANQITTAIYRAVAEGRIDCLDVVFTGWKSARPALVRQRLFPIDLADLPKTTAERPLTQLPDDTLIASLGQDYFNAQVCKAALHAFASENEARMEAMSSAGSEIARELETFQATLSRVRQEAITAEIIELGTGAAARRGKR